MNIKGASSSDHVFLVVTKIQKSLLFTTLTHCHFFVVSGSFSIKSDSNCISLFCLISRDLIIMHVALAWKVGPLRSPAGFILIFAQVIFSLALLVDGTISEPTSNERATAEATFQVYSLPGCGQAGINGQETTIYQLSSGECVNTASIPDVDDRFLSYIAKINEGVTVRVCFFDSYPGKDCTGIYSGFDSGPERSGPDYSNKCQNVLQGFTDLKETYGAKSVNFSCVVP